MSLILAKFWPYIAGLVLLAGGGLWLYHSGDVAGAARIQSQWNIDKLAQAKVLADAQSKSIKFQQDFDLATQKAQADHAKMQADNDQLVRSMGVSVHNLEAALLRARAMSSPVANSGQSQGTGTSASSDPELEAAIGRTNDAIAKADSACLHDAAELTAVLAIAP